MVMNTYIVKREHYRQYKMVDSKSEVTSRTSSTEVTNLYDTATQNCIRILDELAKAHPQYTQSVSNLQHDYVIAAKNTIQNMVLAQKMLGSSVAENFRTFNRTIDS